MLITANEHLGPIPDKRRRKVKPPTQRVSVELFSIFSPAPAPVFKKKQVGFTVSTALDNHLLSMIAMCAEYNVSASVLVGNDSATLLYIKARQALKDKMREAGLHVDNMDFINIGNVQS